MTKQLQGHRSSDCTAKFVGMVLRFLRTLYVLYARHEHLCKFGPAFHTVKSAAALAVVGLVAAHCLVSNVVYEAIALFVRPMLRVSEGDS